LGGAGKMSQGMKVIAGLLAGIILVLMVSVVVWTATTVNQLTKDKDRLDLTMQKLDERANLLAEKVQTLESQSSNATKDIDNIHRDINDLDAKIGDFTLAAERQLYDIKKIIVEQNTEFDDRISTVEHKNAEYSGKIEELNHRIVLKETSSAQTEPVEKKTGRVFVDVNNPKGLAGWGERYTVKLRSIVADEQNFRINWGKPFSAKNVSPKKPDIVKKTPKFKYANQLYFFLELGDAADNRIVGVIDFATTDKKYFPFDLYLDKNRNGNLADNLIPNFNSTCLSYIVSGIKVPYKDGTTEDYALELYAPQQGGKVSVWYQPKAGRYGVLEANKKRIGILVLDNSGKGLFNDSEEAILMDWNLDGTIDGSSQAQNDRELYSALELPGATYRVTEIDPAGRYLTLSRMH
jgi:chaperonin cofactor prefoldin